MASENSDALLKQHFSGIFGLFVFLNITQYMNKLNKIGLWLIPWFVRNESVYLQKHTDSRRKQITSGGCWIVAKRRRSSHLGPRAVCSTSVHSKPPNKKTYIENAVTIKNELFTIWKKSSLCSTCKDVKLQAVKTLCCGDICKSSEWKLPNRQKGLYS